MSVCMALEASLALNPTDGDSTNAGGDDGIKPPRLPRWTRQEILVLIQGKRVAENRVRRGRVAGMGIGSGQVEPKWASISTYCKRHGVNRGPVQCRKRWSNLAGDFKKIKEWESRVREESESFWVMRNDLRRERKLPGFFDRDVYDILDGVGTQGPTLELALATVAEETSEAVFDSGRCAKDEDGLFSDFEKEETGGGCSPENEVAMETENVPELKTPSQVVDSKPVSEKSPPQPQLASQVHGSSNEKQSASDPEMGSAPPEGRKRKRDTIYEDEETMSLQSKLIDVMERSGKMLISQLEAQNVNFLLEQEQRKDYSNSLLGVLNKLADAVGRIADRL